MRLFDEQSVVVLALKVLDAVDGAVVFALWLVQLHAHPLAYGELGGAKKADHARLAPRDHPGADLDSSTHRGFETKSDSE